MEDAITSSLGGQTQQIEANKSAVRRAHREVWSQGNMAAIDELYGPHFIAHWVSGVDTDLQEFKELVARNRSAFPDMKEEILHIVAEGDLVVTHFINSCTFEGALDGIPPTGRSASNPEMAIHRLDDGKIVEQWTLADRLNLLAQLGIEP